MSHGIDYGLGTTNRDPQSGIRYGVIPMNAISCWAWESMEAEYGDPQCPDCESPVADYDDDAHGEYDGSHGYRKHRCCDYACDSCKRVYDSDEVFPEEPCGHTISDPDYSGVIHGGDSDLFVTCSPYYTHARFCSPCAPGACYLLNPTDKSGPRCYCLGHDWFDKGKAPYPVFRVSDGTLVKPGQK